MYMYNRGRLSVTNRDERLFVSYSDWCISLVPRLYHLPVLRPKYTKSEVYMYIYMYMYMYM